MSSVTLVLPYPVSANVYWRSRIVTPRGKAPFVSTYVSPEAKAYKEAVGWTARAAGIRAPLAGRLVLTLQLYPHRPLDWKTRMRKHGDLWDDDVQCQDLGNTEKVLADALQGNVIGDDKKFWEIHLYRMEPDAHPARIVATVTPIARAVVQPGLDMDMPTPDTPAAAAPAAPLPMVVAVSRRRKASQAEAEAYEARLRAADPALYADGLPF